jgi:hypothetical protein
VLLKTAQLQHSAIFLVNVNLQVCLVKSKLPEIAEGGPVCITKPLAKVTMAKGKKGERGKKNNGLVAWSEK